MLLIFGYGLGEAAPSDSTAVRGRMAFASITAPSGALAEKVNGRCYRLPVLTTKSAGGEDFPCRSCRVRRDVPRAAHHGEVNKALLWSDQDVAVRFLDALDSQDTDIAVQLLAGDVVYVRTGWRTLRGRATVAGYLRRRARSRVSAEGTVLSAGGEQRVVLAERVVALLFGAFRMQFWVFSHFEVRDGRIAYWRDYFDYAEIGKAVLVGLVGLVIPAARSTLPRSG
jgi:limonene-1,2-epoxide hydrolase